MTLRRHSAGFTIIELMVTLVIAAVLLGIALPAFDNFINQQRMTTDVNALVANINFARSEAARTRGNVSLQAAGGGTAEWDGGYCVVAGNPGDCNGPVLRQVEALTNATLDGIDGIEGLQTLTFNSRGLLVNANGGNFQLCSTLADVDPGRVINISAIGRTAAQQLTCN